MYLVEAYSQNKDELMLSFVSESQEFHLRAVMTPSFAGLSFPAQAHRKATNTVSLLDYLEGKRVKKVSVTPWDRSILIQLEGDFQLLLKMHGKQSNCIVFEREAPIDVFRHHLTADLERELTAYQGQIHMEDALLSATASELKRAIPVFDKSLAERVFHQMQLAEDKAKCLKQNLEQLQSPPAFYVHKQGDDVHFSLIAPNQEEACEQFENILDALNRFSALYLSNYRLAEAKKSLRQDWQKRLKQTTQLLQKTETRLQTLSQGIPPDEIGHILMANLHQIPARAEQVELYDFYRDRPIVITLKKDLSPQDNAAVYYRKSKNQNIELEKLQALIASKAEEMQHWKQQLDILDRAESIKELKPWIKEKEKVGKEEEIKPYKEFIIDGYQVWVGKNAKSNDELTGRFTHKDDLWMHAKDVAGSHTIIKHKPGSKIPNAVLEKAASLAAWYSKSKNESLAAVLYTQKKWVRKAKGLGPGKVRVEREEVILVKPANFESLGTQA
jgi:predicted ribosome quality control (RQC) complex YloA/Tae2 family protein